MHKLLLASVVVVGLLISTKAYAAESSLVTVERDNAAAVSFAPFTESPGTIGGIASGDLGTDGIAEIVVGAGAGLPPTVAVFRQDGSKIGQFLAYAEDFRRGVNVAVCDIDGDGTNEIVTGARFGGGPHVRVFDRMGNSIGPGFFAYGEGFRGGVNVACGDLDHDGIAEIVTGAGPSGGPHVRVFTYRGDVIAEGFNGSAAESVGAHVAVHSDTILAADVAGDDATVTAFVMDDGELRVATSANSNTRDDLAMSTVIDEQARVIADVTSELFHDTSPKYILVDISDQTLTAYEYGVEVNKFLVSTGTYYFPTPLGKTQVYEKIPWKDYIWSYGANNPNNYNIPNVQYNLRIYKHIYIHYAYWHNNFGNRMSHGCINVNYENAAWIYDWTDVGTAVEIVP